MKNKNRDENADAGPKSNHSASVIFFIAGVKEIVTSFSNRVSATDVSLS